ncbi:MAG: VWA domain-containing protein, partial [Desulfobulbaceae bacterium]|nr:VWA domain-containing protein [Desulfobulbaceae bacterium]
MTRESVKNRLHQLIGLDSLHSWDVDEHIDQLAALPKDIREEVFRQIMAIWPVSYALCFAFLDQLPKGLSCLQSEQLSAWVNATLDVYENSGLQAASRFLAEVEKNFACKLHGTPGLSFDEARGRLQPYLLGIAGYEIALSTSDEPYTDTTTIFLAQEISLFNTKEENFLLYKLTASLQWALITTGLFRLQTTPDDPLITTQCSRYQTPWPNEKSWLHSFCSLFPQPELAEDLLLLAETVRATSFLTRELPGLMRDFAPLRYPLQKLRPSCTLLSGPEKFIEELKQWVIMGTGCGDKLSEEPDPLKFCQARLATLNSPTATARDSATITASIYAKLETSHHKYQGTAPINYTGVLKAEEAEQARKRRRMESKKLFVDALANFLPESITDKNNLNPPPDSPPPTKQGEQDQAAIIPPAKNEEENSASSPPNSLHPQTFITLNDEQIEMPESLQPLVREITNDLGHIPQDYISSASQRAGSGRVQGSLGPDELSETLDAAALNYDEWDFRRAGFRKSWCTLQQKELLPVKGTFIAETMNKYQGQMRRLRRQFELMRSQQRFAKRQRDGDDIDLDAIIETQADLLAGLPPSERLYIRLIRDQRNINTVFLVDMSSSTEGWIGTAIKEALVLMCESLSVLGDSYAIYGFSGMRRSRSELYHIKHLDEPYGETVRERITAINPREYTRMEPPIRHLTDLLANSEA